MVNDERDICAICAIFNLHLTSAQTYRENIRKRLNRGVSPDLHSYRDSHGNEVDLVVRDAGKLFPVEIKSASTFTSDFIKGIERFRETAGERCGPGLLCYNGKEELFFKKTHVLNPYILHAGKIRFPALFSATQPPWESCAKTEDARNRSCRLRGDKT